MAKKDCTEEDEEENEDGLFGCLPLHLKMAILALLPLPKLLQLRCVCRSWNSLLQSASFNHLYHSEDWLLMAREVPSSWPAKEFVVYIPSQRKLLPLPGLLSHPYFGPSAANVVSAYGPFDCPTALGFALHGSYGGLLCCLLNQPPPAQGDVFTSPEGNSLTFTEGNRFTSPQGEAPTSSQGDLHDTFPQGDAPTSPLSNLTSLDVSYSVLVFNPLTGAAHWLPSPPLIDPDLCDSKKLCLSMHAHNTNHYSVVLTREFGNYDHMEIYDSRARIWKVAQPRNAAQYARVCSVLDGEVFYWDLIEGSLFSYNLQRDMWCKMQLSQFDLPSMSGCSYSFPMFIHGNGFLLRCRGGRFLLAMPLSEAQQIDDHELTGFWPWRGLLGFVVFQLNVVQEKATWTPLSYTPMDLWEQHRHLLVQEYYLSFVTDGRIICMTGRAQGMEDLVPLMYDLVHDSWYYLPSNANLVGLSCFQPSLSAHPFPQ